MAKKYKNNYTLGQVIEHMRYNKMLTQEGLAKRTTMTRGTISNIENDRFVPSPAALAEVFDALA